MNTVVLGKPIRGKLGEQIFEVSRDPSDYLPQPNITPLTHTIEQVLAYKAAYILRHGRRPNRGETRRMAKELAGELKLTFYEVMKLLS